jgi:hypothetical protein
MRLYGFTLKFSRGRKDQMSWKNQEEKPKEKLVTEIADGHTSCNRRQEEAV